MTNISALRGVAAAALDDEWHARPNEKYHGWLYEGESHILAMGVLEHKLAHIVAFQPAVALALLDQIAALTAERDRLAEALTRHHRCAAASEDYVGSKLDELTVEALAAIRKDAPDAK